MKISSHAIRKSTLLSFALLGGILALPACDDQVDLGDAAAPAGQGDNAGASGKAGAVGSAAGAGSGSSGGAGSGQAGTSGQASANGGAAGGSAGEAGSEGDAGGNAADNGSTQKQHPTTFVVEPPPPLPTNTTCLTATQLDLSGGTKGGGQPIPANYAQQTRVVDAQSRHFSYFENKGGGKRKIAVATTMVTGPVTIRVRETCGGAVVAEDTLGYILGEVTGVVFQAAQDKFYQFEIIAVEGLQYGVAVVPFP